MRTTEPVRMHI